MSNLDIVHCTVTFPPKSNAGLFNEIKLHDELTDQVAKFLSSYGIEYLKGPVSGKGGGGVSSLWQILKELRNNLPFFVFVYSAIVTVIRRAWNKYLHWVETRNRPRLAINLSIESDEATEPIEIWKVVTRLKNLRHLSDELYNQFTEKYPVFVFDRYLTAKLENESFSATWKIAAEHSGKFSRFRNLRQIERLMLNKNESVDFTFTAGGFVRKTIAEAHCQGKGWSFGPKTK